MNLNRPLLLIAVLCVLLFGALALAWQRQESRPPPAPVVVVAAPEGASAAAAGRPGAPRLPASGASAPSAATAASPVAAVTAMAREFDNSLGGTLKLDAQALGEIQALLGALPPEASREEMNRVRAELRALLPPDDAEMAEGLMRAYQRHIEAQRRDAYGPNAPAVPLPGR